MTVTAPPSTQTASQSDKTKAATESGKVPTKKTTTEKKATAKKGAVTKSKKALTQTVKKSVSTTASSTKTTKSTSSSAKPTTTAPKSSTSKSSSIPKGLLPVVVSKNVDGDTIHVTLNGQDQTIRMLLIDTPEDVDPRKPIEPYAYTATRYAASKLPVGKHIYIKEGIEKRDKYNRLLAYVYVTPTDMYNEDVVKAGLARVGYIYNDTTYLNPLEADQSYAKSRKLNIWSVPNYVDNVHDTYNMSIACSWASKNGYSTRGCGYTAKKNTSSTPTHSTATSSTSTSTHKTTSSAPKTSTSSSSNSSLSGSSSSKCNIKGSSTHIYHIPGDPYYNRTTHVVQWFCSVQDAVKAGYRAPKR